MTSTLSCFFMVIVCAIRRFKLREEHLPDKLFVRKGCFGAGVSGVDVDFIEVRIPQISIAGDNRAQHLLSISLPEDLQRGCRIDCRLTHRKEIPDELKARIEVLTHLIERLSKLHQTVQ